MKTQSNMTVKESLTETIKWLDEWIEKVEDYLPVAICLTCRSKNVIQDSDGLEDTLDSHLGHSWLECKDCGACSDTGGEFFSSRDEIIGISQELENLIKTK